MRRTGRLGVVADYDEVIAIGEAVAFATARRAARAEGIFSGPSTGANLAAALILARRLLAFTVELLAPEDNGAIKSKTEQLPEIWYGRGRAFLHART